MRNKLGGCPGEEKARPREQPVQRPWGGACVVYVRNNKEEGVAGADWGRGAKQELKAEGCAQATCSGLWAIVMTLAFTPSEMGTVGGS